MVTASGHSCAARPIDFDHTFASGGFAEPPTIDTIAVPSRAESARGLATGFVQGSLLRNEIEARDAGKLEAATDYAASKIASRHGSGEVATKIQAHIIVAVV